MSGLFREIPVEYDEYGLLRCPSCDCNMLKPLATRIFNDENEMEIEEASDNNTITIKDTEKLIIKFECTGCSEGWFPAKKEERDIHYLVVGYKKGNTRLFWREKRRNYENEILEYTTY